LQAYIYILGTHVLIYIIFQRASSIITDNEEMQLDARLESALRRQQEGQSGGVGGWVGGR
jgi:hypothetical protein